MRVSNNPNYRPSDPPQVGSQQFGSGYGSGPGGYGSGQYGSGAGQYGSGAGGYDDVPPVSYGGGQYTDYGQYLDSVGPSGGPGYAGQSNGYSQPNGYSRPVTYGTYGAPMVVYRKSNALAGWALWMGVIGLGGGLLCMLLSMLPVIGWAFSLILMVLWIAPILAVIFGHVSLGQIKRTGEDGRGQAMTGLILGYVNIGLGILFVIIAAAIGVGLLALLSVI